MTTTVRIDDDLLKRARQLTGITEKTTLVHNALKALLERESARQLARLGGTEPQMQDIPRRRSPPVTPATDTKHSPAEQRKPKEPLIGSGKDDFTILGDITESVWPGSNAERGFLINEEQG